MEIEINKDNCSNLYFDDLGQISFTRIINGKIYNVNTTADDIFKVLHNLSKMGDDDFKLISQLQKSLNEGESID